VDGESAARRARAKQCNTFSKSIHAYINIRGGYCPRSMIVPIERGRGVGEDGSTGVGAGCILKGCHMPPKQHLLCQIVKYF
jgi:hypothetical protein